MLSKDNLDYRPIPLPDRFNYSDEQAIAESKAFRENMSRRHSVRDFTATPVPASVIENCIAAAGLAPSGANHQPWHFVAIVDSALKSQIRTAAEAEEKNFYSGGGSEEWIKALEPIGTGPDKPHLEIAPWLIVIFGQRYGEFEDGTRFKNYYVNESVGIATGILITALHRAGLCCLTHTPNPMKFLNNALDRPASEKPIMILAVGHPAEDATIPAAAKIKKPLEEILTIR